MKKDTKKVWQEMEKLGWSNEPKDFHLEYFEDIIEATKQAFSLTDVSKIVICENCNNWGDTTDKNGKLKICKECE